MSYLLNIIIFFPALGALLLYVLKGENVRIFGIIVAVVELCFVALLCYEFNGNYEGIQFYKNYTLIESYGIGYCVGVDGISIFLLLLNALLTFLALYFFKYLKSSVIIAVLCLESIIMGVFCALDVLMFYVLWELTLLPVLYLLGVWGGERRIYAAYKYFAFAFTSSLITLVGILYFAYQYLLINGVWSFNLLDWYQIYLDVDVQKWLFFAFFAAMAVKIPLFPLHAWQPHAYTQAPMIGSVLIAAVLSKMGTYALLRFLLPLFPNTSYFMGTCIGILCVIMVLYGALLAYAQKESKTLLAYASLSHMGIIVLGVFSLNSEGMSGAVFFMVAHGIIVGSLFLLLGVLESRFCSSNIDELRGLAHTMPQFSTTFGIVMMSSLGLPLTMGFVAEVLCLYGFFKTHPILAFLAGSSFFVGAIYMLTFFKKVFFGTTIPSLSSLKDLNLREKIVFAPLIAILIGFGIYPKPLLDPISASTDSLSRFISAKSESVLPKEPITDYEYPQSQPPRDFDDRVLTIPEIGE